MARTIKRKVHVKPDFPVEYGEAFQVRNGSGKVVEDWQCVALKPSWRIPGGQCATYRVQQHA